MTLDDIAAGIDDFVRTQNAVSSGDPGFGWDIDLFECGYVDSVGLVELLAFIVDRFGVEIDDSDLLSDDFATIHGMARIVCRVWERSTAA